jgi:hypothetical protein
VNCTFYSPRLDRWLNGLVVEIYENGQALVIVPDGHAKAFHTRLPLARLRAS